MNTSPLWYKTTFTVSVHNRGYFDPTKGAMYYITDWQGNNAAVVNSSGAVEQNTDYYPYGEPTVEPKGQRYLFGGKEREHAGGRNTYDFGARSLTPYGSWPSPDPLAHKFYPISPYSYCGGDPINRVDFNGLDIFEFNSVGALVNIVKEYKYDLVRITNPTGRIQERIFEYGTIKSIKTVNFAKAPSSYYFKVNGIENSNNIYVMLATNTTSEWSLTSYQDKESGKIVNYIGTSLMEGEEHSGVYLITDTLNPEKHILKKSMHSHPNNTPPSGCPEYQRPNVPENGDIPVAKLIQKYFPYFDSFELLRVKSLKVDKYNKDSHISDFEPYPKPYIGNN